MSASAKESRYPASKSDSSGSGVVSDFEMRRTMAASFSCLSFFCPSSVMTFGMSLLELLEQHISEETITVPGEMNIVGLRKPCQHPAPDNPRPAHVQTPVPECHSLLACNLALNIDDF